jgi:RND family efflux transporter MFP subunit
MQLPRHVLIVFLGLLVVVLTSCSKAKTPEPGKPAGTMAPRAVKVGRAELRGMALTIGVTGSLSASEQATLSAKVAGRLQAVNVDVGSRVKAGEVLAQVEPRDYELRAQQAAAALAQARVSLGLSLEGEDDRLNVEEVSTVKQAAAVLQEATKSRERVKNLSRSGIASDSDLDSNESTYRVARARYEVSLEEARTRMAALGQRRAEYDISRKQLSDASFRAPFDAAVQVRLASVGEYVAVGAPIVRVVKTDPLRLRLEVPERESAKIKEGQTVHLWVEGDTNVFQGRIARLSPALNEQSRILLVEADVPAQGTLRPGLFARAEIVLAERQEVVAIPVSSLVTFAGLEKVVLIKDGKALERTVKTGRRDAGWAEIIEGVAAGESIVLDPAGLRTGQPLTLAEGNPGDSGGMSKR